MLVQVLILLHWKLRLTVYFYYLDFAEWQRMLQMPIKGYCNYM